MDAKKHSIQESSPMKRRLNKGRASSTITSQKHPAFKPCNSKDGRKLINREGFLLSPDESAVSQYMTSKEEEQWQRRIKGLSQQRGVGFYKDFKVNSPKVEAAISNYMNEGSHFNTYLNQKDEIPRLSILENYKQISRIMRSTYMK